MATQAEIEALAVRKEIEANIRAQAAGFPDAAAMERDANRRSIEAGFASAADQEIDANRRAMNITSSSFLTALPDQRLELPEPRIKQWLGGGKYNYGPGTGVSGPSDLTPEQTDATLRDQGAGLLSQPTTQNTIWGPPVQAGGGYGRLGEYSVPPRYMGPASLDPYVMQSSLGPGWDYQYPGMSPNGMIMGWGGGPGGWSGPGGWATAAGVYPGGGGGVLGPIGPGTGAGAGAGGTKYPGVITGSDKEQDLDSGRTHHVEMYDQNDMWIGAEGTGMGGETRSVGPLGNIQRAGGAIESRMPTARVHDPDDPLGYSPSGPSYSTAGDPSLGVNALRVIPTQATSHPDYMPAYSSDPQNAAAARQAAKNMALARTLGPDTGLLAGQDQLEQQAAAAAAMNNAAAKQAHTGGMTMQQAAAQKAAQIAGMNQMSGGPNYNASNNADINAVNEARIQDIISNASSYDDEIMRSFAMGNREQQRALARAQLNAAGGMEMGGILGMPEIEIDTNVDVGGTRGSATGGFGRE